VRFDRTGVLKGFIIFLTATAWPVSWSLAELRLPSALPPASSHCEGSAYQTSPKAPMPTGWRSVYLAGSAIVPRATLRALPGPGGSPARDLEGGPKYLGANKFRHLAVDLRSSRVRR
jgi:hypothetical protein